jgi:hypothetical protein
MSRFRLLTVVALAFSMLAVTAAPALAQARPRPQTWVDGQLFNGVVTPATFDPANGNFDELYAGCAGVGGFKNEAPLISESKPGDQDYNGGRWHENLIKSTALCAQYADVDRVEDLDLNDFVLTGTNYFECPLLPLRGGRA